MENSGAAEAPTVEMTRLPRPLPSSLSPSPPLCTQPPPVATSSARFSSDDASVPRLLLAGLGAAGLALDIDLRTAWLFRLGPVELLCVTGESSADDVEKKGLWKMGHLKHLKASLITK